MKKLVIAAAIAVGLSFPITSQAEVNAFGVSLPLERTEVNNDARGGYVAQNLMDTLKVQKLNNQGAKETIQKEEPQNVYSGFRN